MKEMTLECLTMVTKTIEVATLPKKWQEFLAVWEKDEDDLTDAEWNIRDEKSLEDMLNEVFDMDVQQVDVLDYK